MGDEVSMKVSLVESHKTREVLVHISIAALNDLTSKDNLLAFILNEVFGDTSRIDSRYIHRCRIERKSKRHKKFVPLECADDFKELRRSLKVKRHLKLVVYLDYDFAGAYESPLSDAVDQIKKISSELQKCELWELLKSLTSKIESDISVFGAKSSPVRQRLHDSKAVHPNIICDSCFPTDNAKQILGTRYKCMNCENLDLCERCYLSQVSILDHVPTHQMLSIPSQCAKSQILESQRGSAPRNTDVKHLHSSECIDIADAKKLGLNASQLDEISSLVPDTEANKFDVIRSLLGKVFPDADGSKRENIFKLFSIINEDILLLENNSSEILLKGEFILKIMQEGQDQVEAKFEQCLKLKASSDIFPGELSRFHFNRSNLINWKDATVSYVHSNGRIVLDGKCSHSILGVSQENLNDSEASVPRIAHNENFQDSIGVTVIPKGKLLSQIAILNKSEEPLEIENLVIKIVNCFETQVASVSVGSVRTINPGKAAKFNVPVNNTHFKFPFRVLVETDDFNLSCGLSLKQLNGILSEDKTIEATQFQDTSEMNQKAHQPELNIGRSSNTKDRRPVEMGNTLDDEISIKPNDTAKESCEISLDHSMKEDDGGAIGNADENLKLSAEPNGNKNSALVSVYASSEELIPSEVHHNSMILPSMPLKPVSSNSGSTHNDTSHDNVVRNSDYDVISIAEATEIFSDYEVLSRTNSYEI